MSADFVAMDKVVSNLDDELANAKANVNGQWSLNPFSSDKDSALASLAASGDRLVRLNGAYYAMVQHGDMEQSAWNLEAASIHAAFAPYLPTPDVFDTVNEALNNVASSAADSVTKPFSDATHALTAQFDDLKPALYVGLAVLGLLAVAAILFEARGFAPA